MQAGGIPAAQHDRLADMALAMQAAGRPGNLVDWLGQEILDGKVSVSQKAKFFEQAVVLELRVRPRVVLGDPIPYEIGNLGRTSPGGQGWWHRIEYLAVTLDGKPSLAGGGSSRGWGFGAGGSSGSWIPCQTPGPHTVSAGARVRIYRGGSGFNDDNARSVLFHEREVTLTGSTVVVPAEAAKDYVRSVEDPSLNSAIRQYVTPMDF